MADDKNIEVDINFHTDELLKDLEFKEQKALVQVGIQAEAKAKIEIESTPRRVDTGRLRNSITWATTQEHSTPAHTSNDDASEVHSEDGVTTSDDSRAVVIGTNVEYAAEVHEGRQNPHLDPNRFLRNAIENNYEQFRKIIDDTLKEE